MTNGQKAKGAMRGLVPVIVALAVLATSAGIELAVLRANEPDASDIPVIETARPLFVASAVANTTTVEPSAVATAPPVPTVSPSPVPPPTKRPSSTPPSSGDKHDDESDSDDDDDHEVVPPRVREEEGHAEDKAKNADEDDDHEVVSPPVREEDSDDDEGDKSRETLNDVQKRESSSRTDEGAKDD